MGNPEQPRWGSDYESLHRRNLELTKEVERLSILREIGLAIGGSLELEETLALVANVVQGALEVRRVTIYELDNKGAALRPLAARYGTDLITRERLEEESVSRRGTPFGEALDTRSVVLAKEPGQRGAYVPLLAKNAPLGVLLLQDRKDGTEFSGGDAAFFRQIGATIAIAINNAQLYAQAVTDGLTGLYVRRYFDLRMDEEFAQAKRYGRSFSLLLFDIDHFKKFNDTHGHQTGDEVLKQFAALLGRNTRQSDICCRYGGEEMTVVLPETGMEEAALLASKLCAQIRSQVFTGTDAQELHVTTSIGVAAFDVVLEDAGAMVAAADRALYQAKELGRNRVELAGI